MEKRKCVRVSYRNRMCDVSKFKVTLTSYQDLVKTKLRGQKLETIFILVTTKLKQIKNRI